MDIEYEELPIQITFNAFRTNKKLASDDDKPLKRAPTLKLGELFVLGNSWD